MTTSDARRLQELITHIEELGGQQAMPVVALDTFFSGNAEEASIAPNVEPHPGVATIWHTLRDIRARPDVFDVVMRISEVMADDEWPFADIAYVITTADAATIAGAAACLDCDVEALDEHTWQTDAPAGAPEVPPGAQVIELWWD